MFKKSFVALFALVSTQAAFAASTPIAVLDGATRQVSQVTVTEDGTATFVRANHAESSVALKPATLEQVKSLATALANAEIVTTHHVVVCMMMPFGPQSTLSVPSSYDFGKNQFADTLKVAMNPQGCWNPTNIAPKTSWAREDAVALENILRTLANELAE